MRPARHYIHSLLRLPDTELEEQRAIFRECIVALARDVSRGVPVPLEGTDPASLAVAVNHALGSGLLDDLSFLSPADAYPALYELAAALREGTARRELGRRVMQSLKACDALTFVALATRIGTVSPTALRSGANAARVALALDLPMGVGAQPDILALALISRRSSSETWVLENAMGALPSRRLAARLLERAAREASNRAAHGDPSSLRVFRSDIVQKAWRRLLSDREPLVWRHVAGARGLLSQHLSEFADEIEQGLNPKLTPTEWRRSATSLGARIGVNPQAALARAREFVRGDTAARDPGTLAAMIWGLTRAGETEEVLVEALLPDLVRQGGLAAVEALVDLRAERVKPGFSPLAAAAAEEVLLGVDGANQGDDGTTALVAALRDDLDPSLEATSLRARITAAVETYAEHGAARAYEEAAVLLELADEAADSFILSESSETAGRVRAFRALRELDGALLAKNTLADLLSLGERGSAGTSAFDQILAKVHECMIEREREPLVGAEPKHFTFRMRRMQTFLHLVDGRTLKEQGPESRERRLSSGRVLMARARDDRPGKFHRVVKAAAARACDALLRDGVCELSDVVLATSRNLLEERDLDVFVEASMNPEVELAVRAYADLGRVVERVTPDTQGQRACLDALRNLAEQLPIAASPRVEALRLSLLTLVQAAKAVAAATSLQTLAAGTDGRLLMPLAGAADGLGRLMVGARRRFEGDGGFEPPNSGAALRQLDVAIEREIRHSKVGLTKEYNAVEDSLRRELPLLVAEALLVVLKRVTNLPAESSDPYRPLSLRVGPSPLPAWLPPGRTLGGFYIEGTLGSGAGGSVFVARRESERHAQVAQRFALKVPEYGGSAARTLTEDEFLALFRQEAGALLSLPGHENIAHFVTFDAGCHPKPILVMELVEGPSLDRLFEMGQVQSDEAFALLDGVAAGLQAMHAAGLAHLDVKMSNVIIRDPDGLAGPEPATDPVLVDFGLAGRHIRPGCGTGEYCAPEVWTSIDAEETVDPRPADIYALGCMLFEMATGNALFQSQTVQGLVTGHLMHDGKPEGLLPMLEHPVLAPLAQFISTTLRQNAEDRPSIERFRKGLRSIREHLPAQVWPGPD